jgi:hypothetical protein
VRFELYIVVIGPGQPVFGTRQGRRCLEMPCDGVTVGQVQALCKGNMFNGPNPLYPNSVLMFSDSTDSVEAVHLLWLERGGDGAGAIASKRRRRPRPPKS